MYIFNLYKFDKLKAQCKAYYLIKLKGEDRAEELQELIESLGDVIEKCKIMEFKRTNNAPVPLSERNDIKY